MTAEMEKKTWAICDCCIDHSCGNCPLEKMDCDNFRDEKVVDENYQLVRLFGYGEIEND